MDDTIYNGGISIRLPLKTGTILKKQYEIVTSLGFGGFGITYLALDKANDNREVAIKELFPKNSVREGNCVVFSEDAEKSFSRISEFIDEAKMMTSVKNERIVEVLDYFTENGTAYYVMEFIDGKTLRDFIKKHGPLDSKQAIHLIKEIALGLKAIHDRGILHGDLKPSNVMMNNKGIKIMDFGAASLKNTIYATKHGKVISWGYSAPERFTNSTIITPQSDIYSLGCILFFMVSGEDPIPALERRKGTRLSIPPVKFKLRRIIKKAMALEPFQRYPTVDNFLKALDSFI
ncbi:hypothetical protein AT15_07640 [Kosmotoga arenicorallina S304]|uniref:Protein kinase domain-containing protein n=1 Tax=Kosmotoga arenicorallina S304 TaxID=1453497 RepID=A0A182C7A0_9BACT|nr:serine/threonine-protein kinase [Kosmotoga arenicorallina]OAA31360.1 hypothetical protein AT15_07640 [Kosmotoga arenicorallina S304]